MKLDAYQEWMTAEYLMGPNSLRILEELLENHPLQVNEGDEVLDLGCGKGLTSLMLAREVPAKIVAADLWIAAEENRAQFNAWGMGDRMEAVQADANTLPFMPKQFHALVSVDSYHYFATGEGFFAEKILPFLRDGASVIIGIPGIKEEFAGKSEELLHPWATDESYMFKSPAEWKQIIGQHERIAQVETWEMGCFEAAWADWFRTDHEYAKTDFTFYDSLIAPYTCFVGIFVQLH